MLVSMVETMAKARENMYCIPALSAANEITVKAAIETAEEKNAPLIMLYMHTSKNPQDILDYGYMATNLARRATVPVSIILDHGPNFETCMLAIRAGFSDVMLDKSSLPYEQNRDEVAAVVKVAHAHRELDVVALRGQVRHEMIQSLVRRDAQKVDLSHIVALHPSGFFSY